ncbi:sulfurtransferase [Streptomyces sp. NPDC014733]|uniref:sulfurtransferase n=1 Tax=Streptomyces sp. NPDC014733 TaxID=3364885 RepID=UPI0036F95BC9
MNDIITATELASASAGDNPPVLLDVRWQLQGPHGRPDYEAGHLPGAVFIDLDTDLAGPAGDEGRHPLPDVAVFTAAMRRAGVRGDRPVVTYDAGLGWAAARAWWLLRWAGHRDVRVLDGGLAAWTASGGAVTTEIPQPKEGDFTPEPGGLPQLTADEAAALARRGVLLDARSAERYRGEAASVDRVGGHIPGAVSAPTTENVTEDHTFRPAAALAERFAALGAKSDAEVGVYCGSGVSGAQEVLALSLAGVPAALYIGSWSGWTADSSRPVATGAQPG